jgi:hypothetical protein
MSRLAVLLALLFAMLWQSLALARVGSTVNVLADMEHAALHWGEESHHHHDDGSYHLDDSNESAQHVFTDQVSATAALFAAMPRIVSHARAAAPAGGQEQVPPSPDIDGLLRPPRLLS